MRGMRCNHQIKARTRVEAAIMVDKTGEAKTDLSGSAYFALFLK